MLSAMRTIPVLVSSLAFAVSLSSCISGPEANLSEGERFFVREVKPLLERNCVRCHNGIAFPGKMNLATREAALAGKRGGRHYIQPGSPDDSLLIVAISRPGTHAKLMPRQEISLTSDQIAVLREWIADGAAWPHGEPGALRPAANPELQ